MKVMSMCLSLVIYPKSLKLLRTRFDGVKKRFEINNDMEKLKRRIKMFTED